MWASSQNYYCIPGTELRIQRISYANYATIETPFVSWNHILKRGYWCMPCCILEENNHSKMPVCSRIPSYEKVCKHNNIHGRCGIDFDP